MSRSVSSNSDLERESLTEEKVTNVSLEGN